MRWPPLASTQGHSLGRLALLLAWRASYYMALCTGPHTRWPPTGRSKISGVARQARTRGVYMARVCIPALGNRPHGRHLTRFGGFFCAWETTPQNTLQAAETTLAIPSQGQDVTDAVQGGMATQRDKNSRLIDAFFGGVSRCEFLLILACFHVCRWGVVYPAAYPFFSASDGNTHG